MAFRALLSKQQPQGCNVPAGPPSVSGGSSNPLTSFLASATQDPLQTQQGLWYSVRVVFAQLMEGYDLSSLQGPLAAPLGAPLGGAQGADAQQGKGPRGAPSSLAVTEVAVPPIEAAAAEAFTAKAAPASWGVEGLLAGSTAAAAAAAAAEAAAEANLMRTSQFKGPLLPPATADATAARQQRQQQQQPSAGPWAAEFLSMQQQQQQGRQRSFEGDTSLVQTWAQVGGDLRVCAAIVVVVAAAGAGVVLLRLLLLILLAAFAFAVAFRQEFSSLSLGEYGGLQQQQQQQQQQTGGGSLAASPPSTAGAFEASRRLAAAAAGAAPLSFFPPPQQFPFPMYFNPMQSHHLQYQQQQQQQQHLQQRQRQQQQQQQQEAQQDEKIAEDEQQDEPARPEAFDPAVARDLVRGLKAVGGAKLREAEFTKFVEALAEGFVAPYVSPCVQLLSSEGERVEWDEVLAAREATKLTEVSEPLLGSSSPEGGSDFDARLKELEEAWKKAHENV
ncbi:hypothetical protein ACSSS7_000491 [Eimeria intestinalis]